MRIAFLQGRRRNREYGSVAWDGSVSFTIPYWTMAPPFGGYIYVNSSGRWIYMWNQCWILYDGNYYDPYC